MGMPKVDINELARKKDEQRKQNKIEKIDGVHEEVVIEILDAGVNKYGTMLTLYTSRGETYTYLLNDVGREILSKVKQGKILRIKGLVVEGTSVSSRWSR